MKTNISKLAFVIGALAMSSGAMADDLPKPATTITTTSTSGNGTATQTGQANARVIVPISIAATTPLEFGAFWSSSAPETVTITPNATGGTVTGTATLITIAGTANRAPGVFTVTGEPGLGFSLTMPTGPVLLTSVKGSSTSSMSLSSFTVAAATSFSVLSSTSSSSGYTSYLTSDGQYKFNVGGTLTATANQAVGSYVGYYSVTVAYN